MTVPELMERLEKINESMNLGDEERRILNEYSVKGILLTIVLVVSTIATFFTDGTPYWNDMAFIVWGLCIVTLVDWLDE